MSLKQFIIISIFLFSIKLHSADVYKYSVNLTKVNNDKLSVSLLPPALNETEIDFMFPSMVPGTYEVYDFGRFISNFKAFGKNGELIKVTKVNINTYKLSPANKIEKITYDVDDTFDRCDLPGTKENVIFEPGGTNFEDGKNFSMNTHTMFGYFKNYTNLDFELEFEKPIGFYPSTGINDIQIGNTKDIIRVNDYHNLVDAPIHYFKPDTATIKVANTNVLVSCYSPNKKITANFIANTLKELLAAQRDYLGGQLPVDKYAFLFYFNEKPTLSGSNGALEHFYSSFYVMPEFDSLMLQQELRDVSAHEFFHIVTPLNIHAKEIGDFDFNNPQMSEHLWLYEGMTEYAAHHAQAKAGITTLDQFLNTMMQKYKNSLVGFNDTMSFTFMSKNVLNKKIHTQYGNVYEKGALIGMCLDILLRDQSNGNYGTQNLMFDLSRKYGKNKSFNDEDLFNDIEKLTSPEIGSFLRKHVGGTTPLPMEEVLYKIGISFAKESESFEFSLGNPDLDFNPKTGRVFVTSTKGMDEFGKELGYKKGDEFFKLNGREIKIDQFKEIISDYYSNLKEGSFVTMEVYRPKKIFKKKYTPVSLTAKAKKIKTTRKNQIRLMENMTEKQKNTLKSWMGIQ